MIPKLFSVLVLLIILVMPIGLAVLIGIIPALIQGYIPAGKKLFRECNYNPVKTLKLGWQLLHKKTVKIGDY